MHIVDPAFWNGRRVLVTGHTGFKGGWLSEMLLHLGALVSGFALEPTAGPSLYDALALKSRMESTIGDVRDEEQVQRCIARGKPEYIFHLAAQSLVRVGYEQPVDTYATNVLGTVHVLEAARRSASVQGVVVVTSDKCYQNREWLWGYREGEALGGDDPYSSSKAAAEMVAHAYRVSYGSADFQIASARAGNVIGGGDWSRDRLVPDIVRAVIERRPLVLRYPNAVRPWQHVLEPLSGYLMLAAALSSGDFGGAWNFGPQCAEHLTVRDLAEAVFRAFGEEPRIEIDKTAQPHEAMQLRLDSTKARELLGWSGRLEACDAVARTAAWYRDVDHGRSARAVTNEQIEAYLAARG